MAYSTLLLVLLSAKLVLSKLDRKTDCCVTVLSARDVRDVDIYGPGNPYILLKAKTNGVPTEISKTAIKDMSSTIAYNEEFCGGGSDKIPKLDGVEYDSFIFQAYADMALQSNPEFIGQTMPVSLSTLQCCGLEQPRELQLIDRSGTGGTGFVTVHIKCDYNCGRLRQLPPLPDAKPCEDQSSGAMDMDKKKEDMGMDMGEKKEDMDKKKEDMGMGEKKEDMEQKKKDMDMGMDMGMDSDVEVLATAVFKGSDSDVDGEVEIDSNGNVAISLTLGKLDESDCAELEYAIYERNDYGGYGSQRDCDEDKLGDVLDPFEVGMCDSTSKGDMYFECATGDLSGRCGTIKVDNNKKEIDIECNVSEDSNDKEGGFCKARLTPESLYGRLIAFGCKDDKNSKSKLFCAGFEITNDYKSKR